MSVPKVVNTLVPAGPARLASLSAISRIAPAEKRLVKKYSTPIPPANRMNSAALAPTAGELSRPMATAGCRKTPTRSRLNWYIRSPSDALNVAKIPGPLGESGAARPKSARAAMSLARKYVTPTRRGSVPVGR